MIRKVLTTCFIAMGLVGCAAQTPGTGSQAQEVNIAAEDAIINASEGLADSATRPTIRGTLDASNNVDTGTFSRSHKYLGWDFSATAGQTVEFTVKGIAPHSGAIGAGTPVIQDVASLVIIYNATAAGNPKGHSLAFAQADDSTYVATLRYDIPADGNYVAIVRDTQRNSTAKIQILYSVTGGPKRCGASILHGTCGVAEFCDMPAGQCGSGRVGGTGLCQPLPDVCPRIVNPVCGCDGKTYNNECEANRAKVSVQKDGACEDHCPPTGIVCSPTCPGSGSNHGAPCRAGNFNATTCTCDPLADCRTQGCSDGGECSFCWGSFACIPHGAQC